MKITLVEKGSIAEELGICVGDDLLEINGRKVNDAIDVRFSEEDESLLVKIARKNEVTLYEIEKGQDDRLGMDFEEMKILSCGNDCIFCFVDQNPKGMRSQLYFRDGDYRLSFMYGNYTTMTNAGPAILDRIITQRLSPQYISVHVTDFEVRKLLMGLKKDDHILEKIKLLHDHGIDMHTQIVLCPGINDGDILKRTVHDLYEYHRHVASLAVVPVGLTDHRFGLYDLKKVDREYAINLLDEIEVWQEKFRSGIGRAFVYPSDEFYIVGDREIPPSFTYDGFPQTENGVGLVRSFLQEFKKQSKSFPERLTVDRRMTMVTGELAAGFMRNDVLPRLQKISGLDVSLEIVPNLLYGRSVTVAGLLSGTCITSALTRKDKSEMVLLPPDILNSDGVFLDDMSVQGLSEHLQSPVMVFDGNWKEVFKSLTRSDSTQSGRMFPHLRVSP
jgi:putative radical SAM enzyme (TIGR03279 family)